MGLAGWFYECHRSPPIKKPSKFKCVEGVGKVGFFCFVFIFLLLLPSAKVTKSSGCKAVHGIIAD